MLSGKTYELGRSPFRYTTAASMRTATCEESGERRLTLKTQKVFIRLK
jgi:hypothetical protein